MTNTGPSNSVDLLIAGAGPAGLAAAIAAAQKGLSVVITESRGPSIDKACGEGLLPPAVSALARLGVDPTSVEHAPFRGIRFRDAANPAIHAEGIFGQAPGIGIRRTQLHQLLLNRALALGVRIHWQTAIQAINVGGAVPLDVVTSAGSFHPRYLVGADGTHSAVRRMAGLEAGRTTSKRVGIRQHFAVPPSTDLVEVYWAPEGQAYLTPVSASEVCVAFVYRSRPATRNHLSLYPALQSQLGSASCAGPSLGAITLSRSLRRVTRGNIALVGDASGSVDAVTGDGLALAFQQALALADAISLGRLANYERAHRQFARRPRLMSNLLLELDRRPLLLQRLLRVFGNRPALFPGLLDLHVSSGPQRLLGSGGLLASLLCILSS